MDEHKGLAERFEANRTHLPEVAYAPDTDADATDWSTEYYARCHPVHFPAIVPDRLRTTLMCEDIS